MQGSARWAKSVGRLTIPARAIDGGRCWSPTTTRVPGSGITSNSHVTGRLPPSHSSPRTRIASCEPTTHRGAWKVIRRHRITGLNVGGNRHYLHDALSVLATLNSSVTTFWDVSLPPALDSAVGTFPMICWAACVDLYAGTLTSLSTARKKHESPGDLEQHLLPPPMERSAVGSKRHQLYNVGVGKSSTMRPVGSQLVPEGRWRPFQRHSRDRAPATVPRRPTGSTNACQSACWAAACVLHTPTRF